MRKSKYPYIVKRHCESCCNGNKNRQRMFRLGIVMLQRAYICTKCGFWKDTRSFLEEGI